MIPNSNNLLCMQGGLSLFLPNTRMKASIQVPPSTIFSDSFERPVCYRFQSCRRVILRDCSVILDIKPFNKRTPPQ